MILLSTAAFGGSILCLIQKQKWYGFYLYLLLASIVQLVQGIVLFLDRGIPQIHVSLSAEAPFSCALFSSIFIWSSILLVFYRVRYRATTKYYSGGEIAKTKTAFMLIFYSFLTLILFILSIMLPASENTDLNSSEVQPQILFFYTLCFQFMASVYVVIYAPLFIYYTRHYRNFIRCYFVSFVFIIVVQIICMVSYIVLLYLTHIRADTVSCILLRVLDRDYLGLLSILYMLAIDREAQWVSCDQYVRTASNTLPYKRPAYQECFECGNRYDDCEHCGRRYNVVSINLPTYTDSNHHDHVNNQINKEI